MADESSFPPVALGYNYGNGKLGLGSSSPSTRRNAFPASPIFKNEIPDWLDYHDKVLRGNSDIVPGGQNFQFTTPDGKTPSRTFSENNPPNIEDVESGPGGLPGSPWTPNVASPDGTTNYSNIPAPPYSPTVAQATDNYGVGLGGTANPIATSATQTKIYDYTLGKWDPTS